MSLNFCQEGIGANTRFGITGARIVANGTVGLQVRNPDSSALDTIEVLTPVLDTDATTKAYVDALVALNITWKEAAKVCATVDITIAAPGANIDGVVMSVGDRVVLKAQGTPAENGIRVWEGAATPMTLPADWPTASEQSGSVVTIQEGTCADEMYIASADPAVVGTDDPVWLLIGTVSAGVTSVADAVAVPAGGSSLIGAGPTGAVTLNVLDDSARISIALAANVITLDIKNGSVDTLQLADDGVTNAKFAPNAAVSYVTGTVVFGDESSTVNIGTIPANSIVVSSSVRVTEAFTNPTSIDLQVNSISRQPTTASDLATVGQYDCEDVTTDVGAADAVLGVSAGLAAGSAVVTFCYLRTA